MKSFFAAALAIIAAILGIFIHQPSRSPVQAPLSGTSTIERTQMATTATSTKQSRTNPRPPADVLVSETAPAVPEKTVESNPFATLYPYGLLYHLSSCCGNNGNGGSPAAGDDAPADNSQPPIEAGTHLTDDSGNLLTDDSSNQITAP